MKCLKGIMAAVLVVAISLTAGQALAWRGHHGGGYGSRGLGAYSQAVTSNGNQATGYYHRGTCTGPVTDIFAGEPVSVAGTVSEMLYYGGGIMVNTGEEEIAVYGVGPLWHWNELGLERPLVGDEIRADCYKVTLSDGSERIIATNILAGDENVALRDQGTGAPLWQGGFRNGGGFRGQGFVNRGVCPWALTQPSVTDDTE